MTDRSSIAVMTALMLAGGPGDRLVLGGPGVVELLGHDVPTLSALLGIIGVGLGQLLEPQSAPALTTRRRAALIAALMLIELTIVIATGKRPLVAMGWGIGLGFAGLSVVSGLGELARAAIGAIGQAAIERVAALARGRKDVQ